MLAAACAVDQDAEVQLYRSVLDAKVPAPPAYEPATPLSLREAMALANRNNEQLAVRGEDYVQALIDKKRAAAAFLPTISFAPFYEITDLGTATPAGSGTAYRRVGSTVQRLEAPVTGSVNLYRGGADAASLRAGDATILQRHEALIDVQASLLLDVARVYYQVLRTERSVEVLRNSLALQEARVTDVERQLQNGLATRLSVAQFRAQRDQTRARLTQVEGDSRNARLALAVLLGTPAVTGPLTGGFAVPAERPELQSCEQQALERREDLHAASAAVTVTREAVDIATAQYYPSLSLDVAGFLYREHYDQASHWTSLLSLNLPLFTGGRIQADVREAWSRFRQAVLDESATRRVVLRDVQTAHNNLQTTDRRIQDLRSEVEATTDALHQAQSAFNHSLATNLDVLTAQDRQLSAQLDLNDAEFDQTVFWLEVVRAIGGLQDFAAAKP
jgi:outer membrane protein TolC